MSPHWQGPFSIVKIPNSFQVLYLDEGREKVTHIRHCKKFQEKIVPTKKEAPPTADVIHKQKRRISQMKGHKVTTFFQKELRLAPTLVRWQ